MLSTPNASCANNNSLTNTETGGLGTLTSISQTGHLEFKEALIGIKNDKGYRFVNLRNGVFLEDTPTHSYSYGGKENFIAHNISTGEKISTKEITLKPVGTNSYQVISRSGHILRKKDNGVIFSTDNNLHTVTVELLKVK